MHLKSVLSRPSAREGRLDRQKMPPPLARVSVSKSGCVVGRYYILVVVSRSHAASSPRWPLPWGENARGREEDARAGNRPSFLRGCPGPGDRTLGSPARVCSAGNREKKLAGGSRSRSALVGRRGEGGAKGGKRGKDDPLEELFEDIGDAGLFGSGQLRENLRRGGRARAIFGTAARGMSTKKVREERKMERRWSSSFEEKASHTLQAIPLESHPDNGYAAFFRRILSKGRTQGRRLTCELVVVAAVATGRRRPSRAIARARSSTDW